jgi:hypothetical protein
MPVNSLSVGLLMGLIIPYFARKATFYPLCFHSYLGAYLLWVCLLPGTQSIRTKNNFSLRLITISFPFKVYEDLMKEVKKPVNWG